MTTTRFVIDRITLECGGASVAIVSARNEWTDREQLCVEIVTTDSASADADQGDPDDRVLAFYCPEPPEPGRRTRVGRRIGSRLSYRAVLAVAVVAALVLSITVAGALVRRSSAAGGSIAPTNVPVTAPPAGGISANPTGIDRRALVSSPADLADRCRNMIDAASAVFGIDDTSFVRALVADHQGQTINVAVHQELADARAVLASRLGGADPTSPWTVASLDVLDAAEAKADATPCSTPDVGQVASAASPPVHAS